MVLGGQVFYGGADRVPGHPNREERDMTTIVCGVDGSAGSRRALAWALGEARLRGASVRAVTSWSVPVIVAGAGMAPVVLPDEEFETGARTALDHAVDEVSAELAKDGGAVPAVERVLVRGAAANALLDAAKDADLLVVGTRGHGGFTGLLLGSVSQQCTHHAPCPVVVVPTHDA